MQAKTGFKSLISFLKNFDNKSSHHFENMSAKSLFEGKDLNQIKFYMRMTNGDNNQSSE